ncbi:isoleucyl-tRNA synthetase [Acanthamoeba polyphaga moumouvirus]|uniref:isoleucine--tRNA ligase n=1 Tax=Acanthamoeba polyphaga moumouvirus TaxID=1269028 RepID=L7RFX8_9VIRU|nr:isoleucyl-tRNA synthetase [Acanthamoeba polyphaga moumouvirus]AGC01825.1 isoleucyl-tRNA synthetase [Acanthamoeba polyphaga moumouvirus]
MSTDWKNTSLVDLEQKIINFWRQIDATKKVLDKTKNFPKKIFLDGPPFATGTMHYGHILVSTIKDTMTRYLTMNGYQVNMGIGWDCHGVPIEMLAKKTIGYITKKDLLEYGIDRHNDICRDMVLKCTDKWYSDFERIGRWIDINNEYKTMDKNFMESVIWSFKQLYEKEMIFEGYKVMPYSTGCNTPLSHFEAKQNYKEIIDPSVTCCFEIISTEFSIFKHEVDYPNYILAWTTTPWTLPSNMALCTYVNGEIVYAFDNQLQCYIIISRHKFEETFSKLKFSNVTRFRIISRISSDDIVNAEYKPPFEYFWNRSRIVEYPIEKRPFRVISDHYVKESGQDSGTGFVHIAPSHGEDDFRVCCLNNIIDSRNTRGNLIDVIDDDGKFTNQIHDYFGIYFRDANNLIIKDLKHKKLLFDFKQYKHSYPFCYRTDTPLIFKICSGWFLNASNEKFREKMMINNSKINWMPSNIGTNHFDNWLQSSVDWCISRSRYWGTPIPIWKSDDGEEIICIGSLEELKEFSGIDNINDLHIDKIDQIKIPSRKGKGMLSRVTGVLDCWFESGSMPYGQIHYPFENSEILDTSQDYIADFITESIDQTRGWFYTLLVLSTAIFNKPAFKNVIVTGIVNAADGQKMSKSKGNYPDPNILMDKYGADTLRLYLLSTPVVKAESIKFDELALAKLQQNSVVKIYNMALFLTEKISLYHRENPSDIITCPEINDLRKFDNILDKWIINKTGILLSELKKDFDCYKIDRIGAKIITYIEQLTNWYLKMSRERMKGFASLWFCNNDDWKQSIQTLLFVMVQFIKIVSPILPFISETVYLMLHSYISLPKESIHLECYPNINDFLLDKTLENKFNIIQQVIIMLREIRKSKQLNNRRPLEYVEIACINKEDWSIIQDVLELVKIECNVLDIKYINHKQLVNYKLETNMACLSTYLKTKNKIKEIKNIITTINNLSEDQIDIFLQNGQLELSSFDIILNNNHITVKYSLSNDDDNSKISNGIIVRINSEYTARVEKEHIIKLIYTAIQMHRKNIGIKPWDIINIFIFSESQYLTDFIAQNIKYFHSKNISNIVISDKAKNEKSTVHEINNNNLWIGSTNII